MELYHSEFVKEGKDWFLRVYIDRDGSQNENQYVSTDDCEKVSRFLSKRLELKTIIWKCRLRGWTGSYTEKKTLPDLREAR